MRNVITLAVFTIFSFGTVLSTNAAEYKTVDISVEGMTCGACVSKVETSLQKVDGVKEAKVSLEKNNANVVYDASKTNEKSLKAAVAHAGFKAVDIKKLDKKTDASAKASSAKRSGCCSGSSCSDKGSI